MSGSKWVALLALIFFGLTAHAQAENPAINEGMNGSWFNPATDGQGFYIEVDQAAQFIALAWFTYQPQAPQSGDPAAVQRWFTAQGNFQSNSADLTILETTGGAFDTAATVTNSEVGSLSIAFASCTEATVNYSIDAESVTGTIPLTRITPDVLCETLAAEQSPSVVLTYMGNNGVFISDGTDGALVDAVGIFNGWIDADSTVKADIRNGAAPYDTVAVVAATHNHSDHFGPNNINAFLNSVPTAQVFAPTSSQNAFPSDRVVATTPARFASSQHQIGAVNVTVINTRHFNQFNNDFSGTTNFAYLIELGGKRILHCGDIDYAADNFEAIRAAIGDPPDAIVLPTFNLNANFNVLISQSNVDLINTHFPGSRVIASHFQPIQVANERNAIQALIPNAIVFDQPLETWEVQP